jgi:hypothetical protein
MLALKGEEFRPYCKENTTLLQYKFSLLMLFKEIIPVYSENHIRPVNVKCGVVDC